MSLYGALFSGVSGMSAESSAMGAISDNITNVNTVGYKATTVNFQTLVTKQVSLTAYSPGGVQSKPRAGVDVQGLLQSTSSSTDVAISGQGFFIVNSVNNPASANTGQFAYTRAGSFKVDKDGYLQNTSGWYMQGWPLMNWDGTATASHQTIGNLDMMKAYKDANGQYVYINDGVVNPQNLKSFNLNDIAGTAAATSSVRMGANLPSGDAVGATHQTNVMMYDSLGNSHNVLMTWTKTGQNAWDVEAQPPEGTQALQLYDKSGNVYSAMGRLDLMNLPSSGAFNMTINGNTWNFVVGSGTNGTPSNTLFADPSAANSSSGTYAANMASIMNQAFLTEYSGKQVTPTLTGGGGTTFTGGTISVTGPLGTSTANLTGLTISQAATAIENLNATTGVHCYVNGTKLAFYSGSAGTVTISGSASDVSTTFGAAGSPTTFAGTGVTYADRVSGTSSVEFRNMDTVNDITLTGLNSLVTGTTGPSLTPTLTGAGSTFKAGSALTITGPSGTTFPAISLAGLTAAQAATTINAQVATTGVGCYWNGTQLKFYTTSNGSVTLSSAGSSTDADSTFGTTTATTTVFTTNGTKVLEQAYDPTAASQNSFTVKHVALSPANTNAITFNGDGTPASINIASMSIDWANGSQDMTTSNTPGFSPQISLFLGDPNVSDGMTQLSGNYQLSYMTQNGAKFGNFSGVSIGTDGIVTALFDNGVTRPVFQIPVASFVNPNGMESLSGNVFIATDFSGDPTLRTPGTAGAGQTTASSLEASTVDIGSQFTTMIVTQRAYSASAKIITTANQMLDDLVQIIR